MGVSLTEGNTHVFLWKIREKYKDFTCTFV